MYEKEGIWDQTVLFPYLQILTQSATKICPNPI